jgi:hypothetical protein
MPGFLKRENFQPVRRVNGPCHPWFDKAITCRADPNAETTEQNATKQPATLEWPDGCSKTRHTTIGGPMSGGSAHKSIMPNFNSQE